MQLSVVVWPWRRHVSPNVCLLMIKMQPKYLCCLNVLAGEIEGNLCVFFVVLVVPGNFIHKCVQTHTHFDCIDENQQIN